jgi:hypothetical protein
MISLSTPLFGSVASHQKIWKIGGSEGILLIWEGPGCLRVLVGRVIYSTTCGLLSIRRWKTVMSCCMISSLVMRSLHFNVSLFLECLHITGEVDVRWARGFWYFFVICRLGQCWRLQLPRISIVKNCKTKKFGILLCILCSFKSCQLE